MSEGTQTIQQQTQDEQYLQQAQDYFAFIGRISPEKRDSRWGA